MTLGTTPPWIEYVENGSTTVHAIPFQFQVAGDILVTRQQAAGNPVPLVEGADYTVSGGGGAAGSITKTSGGVVGATLRIRRNTARSQDTDFTAHDTFPSADANLALDREMAVSQELDQSLAAFAARALRVRDGETLPDIPEIAARKATILGWDPLTGAPIYLSYQQLASLVAPLLNIAVQGVPGPGTDLTTHVDSFTDGSGNDTAAFAAAIAAAQAGTGILRLGKHDYHVDRFTIPGGVRVIGAGKGVTRIFQRPGQPSATPIATITGSFAWFKDCDVVGNIATDPDEFMHGCYCDALIGVSLVGVEIDINGYDLRGDVVYVGRHSPNDEVRVKLGAIYGNNILRSVVSVVGGSHVDFESITGDRVGYAHLNAEPEGIWSGVGSVTGRYVRGRNLLAAGASAAVPVDNYEIDHVDQDPAYAAGSTPGYVATANIFDVAVQQRNTRRMRFNSWKANGFNSNAWRHIWNGGELAEQSFSYGVAFLTAMCQTEAVRLAYFVGNPTVSRIEGGWLGGSQPHSNIAVFQGCYNSRFGATSIVLGAVDARLMNDCQFSAIGPVLHSGGNGLVALGSPNLTIMSGSLNVAQVFAFCEGSRTISVDVTAPILNSGQRATFIGGNVNGVPNVLQFFNAASLLTQIDGSGIMSSIEVHAVSLLKGYLYDLAGHQVVGQRGAAIANAGGAAGPDPTGAEFNALATTVNLILAFLRNWGAIAP